MAKFGIVVEGELGCESVRLTRGAGAGLRWSSKRLDVARESMSKKSSSSLALLASWSESLAAFSARTGRGGRLRPFLKIL